MTKGIVSRSISSPSETVAVHFLCHVSHLIFVFQTLFVTGLTVAHTVRAADDGCVVFVLMLCTGFAKRCADFTAASQVFWCSEGAFPALACTPLQQHTRTTDKLDLLRHS
jgi:hypothetical protein